MPILNKDDLVKVKEYDDFIKSSPYTHTMQDMAWAKVKNNWISEYVYLEENGRIIAAMSILGIRAVDDKYFLYAPRGAVCDMYDTDLVLRLIEEAKPIFKKYDTFLLRLDPSIREDITLIEKYKSLGFNVRSKETDIHSFSNPRYEIMLTIKEKSEEEVFASFNKMTKRHIKASIKNGVGARFSRSKEDLDTFFELTKVMAKRQNITHRPKEYFERLMEAFPEARIYISEYEDKPIAAMIGIPYGNRMWYIYGATQTMQGKISPGYLLIWEIIKWGIELSLDYFNMGGTYSLSLEDGLFFFKHGFCNSDEPFVWLGEIDYVICKEVYEKFIK